jgi:hypothetical protein
MIPSKKSPTRKTVGASEMKFCSEDCYDLFLWYDKQK